MALSVDLDVIAGAQASIPRPPKPADNGDTPVGDYVPKGMSAADRKALREAGKEWVGTLGGFLGRNHPTKGQAGQNMSHFLSGGGKDRSFSAAEVDEMMGSLTATGTAVANTLPQKFVALVHQDMQAGTATIKRYLARNTGSSVNAGTNWFGVTAETGSKWFYAVGSFLVACGGYAVRQGKVITIFYRVFIYDRYNWDVESNGVSKQGKETAVPQSPLSVLLDDDRMDAIQGLTLPNGTQTYFRRGKGYDGKIDSYIVNDALMGALVESGDAQNFDMVGAGSVHWVRIGSNLPGPAPQPSARSEGTVR